MSCNSGDQDEAYFSKVLHQKYTPILVSSLVLRQMGAGQIDIAVLTDQSIHIVEVKSSGRVTWQQIKRLRLSANWLCHLLDQSCQLWLAKKLLPKGHRFTNLNL